MSECVSYEFSFNILLESSNIYAVVTRMNYINWSELDGKSTNDFCTSDNRGDLLMSLRALESVMSLAV